MSLKPPTCLMGPDKVNMSRRRPRYSVIIKPSVNAAARDPCGPYCLAVTRAGDLHTSCVIVSTPHNFTIPKIAAGCFTCVVDLSEKRSL